MSKSLDDFIQNLWDSHEDKGINDYYVIATASAKQLVAQARRGSVDAWSLIVELLILQILVRLRKVQTREHKLLKAAASRTRTMDGHEQGSETERRMPRTSLRVGGTHRGRPTRMSLPAIPGLEDHYDFENVRYNTFSLSRERALELRDRRRVFAKGVNNGLDYLEAAIEVAEVAWAKNPDLLFGEAFELGRQLRRSSRKPRGV